jgi:hypothetical protein
MFVVQISFIFVTFLSLMSRNLSLMQTTHKVNPHPRISPCVSATFFFIFFFLCHLLNVGACICHITQEVEHTRVGDRRMNLNCIHISFVLFYNITCYTNSIITHINVNTTKLCNIMCTLVATCVILWSLKCITFTNFSHLLLALPPTLIGITQVSGKHNP